MINQGYIVNHIVPHTPITGRAWIPKPQPLVSAEPQRIQAMPAMQELTLGVYSPHSEGVVVVSAAAGRTWVLTWDEIAQMAVEAGINQP